MNSGRLVSLCGKASMTLIALACLCGALRISRADVGNWPAVGTSSVTYAMGSDDWVVASQTYTYTGNPTSVSAGYIQAEVWSSQAGASSSGTETCTTTFAYTGSGSPDTCYYTSSGYVTAFIGLTGQMAYAQEYIAVGDTEVNEIDVLNNSQVGQMLRWPFTTNVTDTNDGTVYSFTEITSLSVGATTP